MHVLWDGKTPCAISLPERLPQLTRNLLLPCNSARSNVAADAAKENREWSVSVGQIKDDAWLVKPLFLVKANKVIN